MKRGLILLGFLIAGLSAVFLLPPFKETDSALSLAIPAEMATWTCHGYDPSEKERKTLAKDTKFAKAACIRPRSGRRSFFDTGPQDRADISIVMSGIDLAQSIHRPERCMPAQGHAIYRSETTVVEVPGGKRLPARRLLSVQEIPTDESGKNVVRREAVTYYFFVGSEQITENHTRRTLIDIKDRLMKGEAQRWAYVSVTMWFKGDQDPRGGEFLEFDDADRAVRELLGELATKNIAWSQVKLPG